MRRASTATRAGGWHPRRSLSARTRRASTRSRRRRRSASANVTTPGVSAGNAPPTALTAALQGAPAKLISAAQYSKPGSYDSRWAVLDNSPIKSVSDLKGKLGAGLTVEEGYAAAKNCAEKILRSTWQTHGTLDGLRVINVENLAGDSSNASGADVRKVDLGDRLNQHLGSGAKARTDKALHNVGPSFSYKLRDASGQAREYNNYMLPVELDGQKLFLAGVRDTPAENFRYLRMPADENGELAGWLRLRQATDQSDIE